MKRKPKFGPIDITTLPDGTVLLVALIDGLPHWKTLHGDVWIPISTELLQR